MKKLLSLFILGSILMLTACDFGKEEKTGWAKQNPDTLETVTYRGKYTSDQEGGYYESKAELIKAFNEYARESFNNISKSWDVRDKLEPKEFTGDFIVDTLYINEERNKVETTSVEEVKEKLTNYKKEYDESCLGFPHFFYGAMQLMIYYMEGDKLMYEVYDSSIMGS